MEIQQNQEHMIVVPGESNENTQPCVELLQTLGLLGNDNLATRETAKQNLPSIIDKFSLYLAEIQDISLKELGIQKVQELSLSLMNSIRVQDKLAGIQFFKELISRNDTQILTPNYEDLFFQEMKKLFKHQDIKIRTIIAQIIGELIKYNFKKYFATLFEFCISVGNECFQVLGNIPNESERESIEPKNIQEISMYLEKQQMSILSEQFSSIDTILQYLCSLVNNLPKDQQFSNEQIISIVNLITQLQSLDKKHLKTYSFELIILLFGKILVNQIIELKEEWNKLLSAGIEDSNAEVINFSSYCFYKVRFKALQVVREYMKQLRQHADQSSVYKIFLPKICFNRYYPASSLSQLSQEIWKEVVEKNGRQLLIQYSDDTLSFYLKQLIANNWEVRQTACLVISEFCSKVANEEQSHKILLKYLQVILDNLFLCLNDKHLQVRIDAFNLLDIIFTEVYYLSKEGQLLYKTIQNRRLIIRKFNNSSCGYLSNQRKNFKIARENIFQTGSMKPYRNKQIFNFQETLDQVLVKLEELFQQEQSAHTHCNHEEVKFVFNKAAPTLCEQHFHQGDLIEGALRLLTLIFLPNIKDKSKLLKLEKFVQLLGKYFYHIKNENSSQIKSTIWTLLSKAMSQIGKDVILLYGNEFLLICFDGFEKMQSNEQNSAKTFIQNVSKIIGEEQFKEMLQKNNGDQMKLYLEKIKM